MDFAARHFHADETTTGGRHVLLRGDRRIMVAAKTAPDDNLDWLLRLLPRCTKNRHGEVKSPELLELAARSKEAKRTMLSAIEHYSIFVVDLFHSYDSAVRKLAAVAAMDDNAAARAVRNILGADGRELAERMLRHIKESLIDLSVIGHVEEMAREVSGSVPDGSLFDRDALMKMDTREYLEAVTRMQILLAEVTDPATHERALARPWWNHSFIAEGEINARVLAVVVADNHTYDKGRDGAFEQVKQAQARLVESIETSIWRPERVVAGAAKMEDSAKVLGITAADLASAVACDLVEVDYTSTDEAVRRLRARFKRVFLNGTLHDVDD